MSVATTCVPESKRDFDSPAQRLRQLERVLLIVEILAAERTGLKTTEVVREVNDRLGLDYVERTIRRDLEALLKMGVVENVKEDWGHRCNRWRWVDRWFRSGAWQRVAETRDQRPQLDVFDSLRKPR